MRTNHSPIMYDVVPRQESIDPDDEYITDVDADSNDELIKILVNSEEEEGEGEEGEGEEEEGEGEEEEEEGGGEEEEERNMEVEMNEVVNDH